jgi:Uma2 family endonuclease
MSWGTLTVERLARYAERHMATSFEAIAATRRWTRAEYDRRIELGIFQPDEKLELLDGQLVVREPQGSPHMGTIRRVVDALRRALGDAWQIDSQAPIALDDVSEPEPDVTVVPRDPRFYLDAHPSNPVLVVEVSGSSYRIDRQYKASLYARARVPEYWIIDLRRNALEIHRQPEATAEGLYGWRYGSVRVLRAGATVSSLLAPATEIAVADLLP